MILDGLRLVRFHPMACFSF